MGDITTGRRDGLAKGFSFRLSPLAILAAALAPLVFLLTGPLTLPIGPMYWDLFIYFDAANRLFDGQMPGVDFFAPVGPLGYWLFAAALKLFPNGQPLLIVDWSLLLVTAPLMAVVMTDVGRRSQTIAYALLAPFLVFSILPFNVEAFSSFPGVDGFGIYNRQADRLLFVLAAALLFCRNGLWMGLVVAGAMLALFLTKITGFLSGGVLCLFAFAACRVGLRTAVASALVFFCCLLALEAAFGFVGAYILDIAALVGLNERSLAPRFLQAASIHLGVVAPVAALVAVLLAMSMRPILASGRALIAKPRAASLAAFLDRDVFWLAASAVAALFFETQNTGGQAFIFVWPALLYVLLRADAWFGGRFVLVVALVAAASLPTLTGMIGRAGRAAVGQWKYERLASTNLGTLGAVSQRPEFQRHADVMLSAYARFPEPYEYIASQDEMPSYTLFADPDFQLSWLKSVDRAVDAVRAFEAADGVRIETVMSLDFANPFPWLLERHAPRHIAIGADPFRAVPDPDSAVADAVRGTDLVLYPKCPVTTTSRKLLSLYGPFLGNHRRLTLTPCWDAFLRNALPVRP